MLALILRFLLCGNSMSSPYSIAHSLDSMAAVWTCDVLSFFRTRHLASNLRYLKRPLALIITTTFDFHGYLSFYAQQVMD